MSSSRVFRNQTNSEWTDEVTAELRRLWAEGYSAGEIADHFGTVSRDAILGKVRRLKLQQRETVTQKKPGRRVQASGPVAAPKPKVAKERPEQEEGASNDIWTQPDDVKRQKFWERAKKAAAEARRLTIKGACDFPQKKSGDSPAVSVDRSGSNADYNTYEASP